MKNMKYRSLLFLLCFFNIVVYGKEYHVSIKGNDINTGTENAPFKTITKAAQTAYPGDVITVHAGTYREWINPQRGGTCDANRIVYRAAPGELAEIKGSERIANWEKVQEGVWKVVLPNSFFGDYNPYQSKIEGDWFYDHGRIHHTGEVFLNNKSFYEMETLEKVLNPVARTDIQDTEGSTYTWYGESNHANTTIWANFHAYNPNKELVEISTRPTCFYPKKQGIDYITIQGFHISQAATQWAPPTAEQIGMVATHWNKGWIIEDNVISNSRCSGITLGKERSTGHNAMCQGPDVDGTLYYIEVVFNTLRYNWNKEHVGSHIVRNNTIFACEQTGICGSMGAAFSIIENNQIYDIWTKRQFSGAEIGGIKFHAAVDTEIHKNRIHHTGRGIWLDWMTQGTRVSENLLYENDLEDLFIEVSHGPFLVENNIFGSKLNLSDMSQGGAYVHNLFVGKILVRKEMSRYTPFHLPHSTEIAGFSVISSGDNRFYNNLFMPVIPENAAKIGGTYGLSGYDDSQSLTTGGNIHYTQYPMDVNGNSYYNQSVPHKNEKQNIVLADFNPNVFIEDKGKEVFITFSFSEPSGIITEIIDTKKLGKARLPKQSYEQPDGSPITIDTDYLGAERSNQPKPGPFESVEKGDNRMRVW